MRAESNLKYPEVFRIHGSTIISMVESTFFLKASAKDIDTRPLMRGVATSDMSNQVL